MDKLTHTESSRVSNVLDDSVEKLALISFLPEQQKHGGVALLSELDEASYAAVSSQWELEQKIFEAGKGTQCVDAALQTNIGTSTLRMCRQLRTDAKSFSILQSYMPERTEAMATLIKCFADLNKYTHGKLSQKVEDLKLQEDGMRDLQTKTEQLLNDKKGFEVLLKDEREKRRIEVEMNQNILDRLHQDLVSFTTNSADDTAVFEETLREEREGIWSAKESREEALEHRIHAISKETEELREETEEKESRARRRYQKAMDQLGEVMQEYDEAMKEIAAKTRDLQAIYDQEYLQYKALDEHFIKIDADKENERQEIEKIHKEAETALNTMKAMKDYAAAHTWMKGAYVQGHEEALLVLGSMLSKLQARVRGHIARKQLRESSKKKKGKGKKGKGKKRK